MKKISLIPLLSVFLMSCQNEQQGTTPISQTVETLKTESMVNFEKSLIKISKGGEKYVNTDKLLSEEGISILLPTATQLLLEKGVSNDELQRINKRDIIEKALRIYQENIANYKSQIK